MAEELQRVVLWLLPWAVACSSGTSSTRPSAATAPSVHASTPAGRAPRAGYLGRLDRNAAALESVVVSAQAHRFLDATAALPSVEGAGRTLDGKPVDDEKYYEADVSDPLHYARVLDLLVRHGRLLPPRSKILDFGYGSVGHLRMLASMGLDVTGIEVKPALVTLYGEPGDTGKIAPALRSSPTLVLNPPGTLRLLHGSYPGDRALQDTVGGGYTLIVSKNVLKKGYIHPDRPAPERYLIKLGVDDATFLQTLGEALVPGGCLLLYNLFVPIPEDQPFKPMSDGRSPFTREQFEAAGLQVDALDVDDTEPSQKVLAATHGPGEEPLDPNLRALYTLVRRPASAKLPPR